MKLPGRAPTVAAPVLGLYRQPGTERRGGRVVLFGDSSCFDDVNSVSTHCDWLSDLFVDYVLSGVLTAAFADSGQTLDQPFKGTSGPAVRSPQNTLHLYSSVLKREGIGRQPLSSCPRILWAPSYPFQNASAKHQELARKATAVPTRLPQARKQQLVRVERPGPLSLSLLYNPYLWMWLAVGVAVVIFVRQFGRFGTRFQPTGVVGHYRSKSGNYKVVV